jgi:hypothetical protein
MSKVSGVQSTSKPATRPSILIPKYNHASKYEKSWEPYIAANLYLYAIPFAIFLRRARELDFSSNKFDRSIQIVQRVIRVFSPEVVDVVSRQFDGSQSQRTAHLVRRHAEVLAPHCPPPGILSLRSLKDDVQSLLEEIEMQLAKKKSEMDFIDRFASNFESLFGTGQISGEQKALDQLTERAKVIVRLPTDYDLLPSGTKAKSTKSSKDISIKDDSTDESKLVRDVNDNLTEYGRQQLLLGSAKINPDDDVPYRGDLMRSRVGSHEIAVLVALTTQISNSLNKKLGLSMPGWRFNLRHFADYRNILFWFVVGYLVLKMLPVFIL